MNTPDAAPRSVPHRVVTLAVRLLLPPLSVLGLWTLAIAFSGMPEYVIPRPGQVLAVLLHDNALIREHIGSTLLAATLGYAAANLVGIVLAVVVTTAPLLDRLLMPAAVTLRNVPYVALATVLSLALGDTMLSKVLIIAIAGFFPVMVNTARGMRSVDPVVLDRMRILDTSPWRVFWQVRLPYSLPYLVAAQEIVGSASIAVAIAAEWMLSSTGLGYVINRSMTQYRGDQVYAVALLAAAMSYLVYLLIQWLSRRLNWVDRQRSVR